MSHPSAESGDPTTPSDNAATNLGATTDGASYNAMSAEKSGEHSANKESEHSGQKVARGAKPSHFWRLVVWRVLVIAVMLALFSRAVQLHMSDYFVLLAQMGNKDAHERALDWDAGNAVALRISGRRALPALDGDVPAEAVRPSLEQFVAALRASPLEVRAMARLGATTALSEANLSFAERLSSVAERLAPVMPQVQAQLVLRSLAQSDFDSAVAQMARAMAGDGTLKSGYFPLLMEMLQGNVGEDALETIARDPRAYSWWQGFFRFVSKEDQTLTALRRLVAMRVASPVWPLQPEESGYYLSRLRAEGLVTEAYLHWVNNLSEAELKRLGYLYDGGFNLRFDNAPGFGWQARIDRRTGVIISRSETFGSSDDASLRVSFSGKRVRFNHVYQELALPAGKFRVSGRVRPDQLEGRKGVKWRLFCTVGGSQTLAETEAYLGNGEWRSFWFDVDVPPECTGQTLRLESAGDREVDHELTGTVWFDDMIIGLAP